MSCADNKCIDPGSCVPECLSDDLAQFACGSDGCGGSCGDCGPGESCADGKCTGVGACKVNCKNKQCGGDGCGGTCGECDEGFTCNEAGTCDETCVPACEDKQCGPDGCGGQCGTCDEPGDVCNESGLCEYIPPCEPVCEGKACGPDGCGGNCGTCSNGLCQGGQCLTGGACKPKAAQACNNGDLWWQDSCGNFTEVLEDCIGGCVNETCTDTAPPPPGPTVVQESGCASVPGSSSPAPAWTLLLLGLAALATRRYSR